MPTTKLTDKPQNTSEQNVMYPVETEVAMWPRACLHRPWLGVPFGLWVVISVLYYWSLISKINLLESQKRMYVTQLSKGSNSMRILPIETNSYKVPDISVALGSKCETIHISMVCMDKCIHSISPMLKSLLFHRQNPIHFHLIVDNTSQVIVNKLFDTWDLPDVKYTCYNGQKHKVEVSWIPNAHYSGVYTLVKLLVPKILPKMLKKVIVLDTDLTFVSDVAVLWSLFRNMTGDQIIGLVENQSNWYFGEDRWPALGRGFNTGVMLLDLKNINAKTNWSSLWQEAVSENIGRLKKTGLGDQDIINAIIKKYPHIVYNISCQYNVQMSQTSLAQSCYGEDSSIVKIIHWNSPNRYNINLTAAKYFRSLHHTFVNLDSNLLREKLHRCWPTDAHNDTDSRGGMCVSFRAASFVKLRTHIYYMDYNHHSGADDDFDVSLVLQLSMDRLPFLERLVKYWEGPLSAAIYLADCELNKLDKFIESWSVTLNARTNIAFHLVFKHDGVHYPVNYLRNVALDHVTTPYVFLMDADFVPMEGLYQHLRAALRLINPYPQKKCLVVAAFESQRYRATPPRTKAELVSRLGWGRADGRRVRGDVVPFRTHEWPRGHRATNYTRWVTATAPYEVEWEPDYEPYLVVHRSVPKYDIRFSGFGWNKVSHSVELRARGYRLAVLPEAFVLHTTHAPSADIAAFRIDPTYRVCLSLLKHEFLKDLSLKYNVTFEELKSVDWVEKIKQ